MFYFYQRFYLAFYPCVQAQSNALMCVGGKARSMVAIGELE